ncbi:ceramide kinase-like [Sinocyclocheilus anshuiensis]|uniref:ceramide kinase-like n=1 Tax=Sinocyclocheilus anshuiensis TaxID=1608454 RepID=UPI0007BAB83D|nr:PREDICTED: ceramide kinase-like [Sinocyclocheilus anshuiensis]
MEIDSVRVESSLWIGNKRYRAFLSGWYFSWTEIDKRNREKKTISVPVSEVIGVKEGRVEIQPQKKVEDTDLDFTLFYVKRNSKGNGIRAPWSLDRTQFCCPSRGVRDQWITQLRTALKTHSPSRPHQLLVFINPFGGKKRGKQIFHSLVAPLFELAGISSHVVVTERANQARDYILKKDLTGFDGVICVGGDGMFSELLHGVIGRTQQEAGVSEHDPTVMLQPCDLHIGIIPAGSTDCVCFTTMGINDPVTSTLHIIIGDSQLLDVCSVHYQSTLVRYSVSMVGYGFYGDVLAESERHRWMGPLRYDYSGCMVYLCNRSYPGLVQYLPVDSHISSPRDNTRCLSGCRVCSESKERLFPHFESSSSLYSANVSQYSSELEGEWVTIEGRFKCISLTCISSSCPRSPKGLSPSAHLADGTADLILVRETNSLGFLTYLHRHTNIQDQFDLPFVEVHRVKAVRFSLPPGEEEEEEEEEYEEGDREIQASTESVLEDPEKLCCSNTAGHSQQHHTGRKERGNVTTSRVKRRGFVCGPCGTKPRSVSVWNCDGEILPHTEISCRVHGQLVRLFARGIEDSTMP